MYLHFMDKIAWISLEKQGNTSKYNNFHHRRDPMVLYPPGKYHNVIIEKATLLQLMYLVYVCVLLREADMLPR